MAIKHIDVISRGKDFHRSSGKQPSRRDRLRTGHIDGGDCGQLPHGPRLGDVNCCRVNQGRHVERVAGRVDLINLRRHRIDKFLPHPGGIGFGRFVAAGRFREVRPPEESRRTSA